MADCWAPHAPNAAGWYDDRGEGKSRVTIEHTAGEARLAKALDELRTRIRARYPDASFHVERGQDDPEAIHLVTTVDVEDTDEVVDLVIDRLLELQVEERMRLYFVASRPTERVHSR